MTRTFAQVIRARRREMGLSQEQFAALLGEGVRQSEVSRLERGNVLMPRRERLQRIAEVIDVPVGELLMLTSWAEADAGAPDAPVQGEPRPALAAESADGLRDAIHEVVDRMRAAAERTRHILEESDATGAVSQGPRD
jgi:transcriptional regulator with XRE-family HTH domain